MLSVLTRCHPAAGNVTRSCASQVTRAAACHGHFLLRGRGAAPRPAVRASSAAATITQHSATTAPRRLIYFNDPAFSCIAARQTLNTQDKYQITPTILYTEGKQKLDLPPCLGRRRGAATPRHPSGGRAAGHTPTGHSSHWLLTSLEASRPQKESPCLIRVSRVSCLAGAGGARRGGVKGQQPHRGHRRGAAAAAAAVTVQ